MLRLSAHCSVRGVDVGRARFRLLTSGSGAAAAAAAAADNGGDFAGQDYSYCRRVSGILRLRLGVMVTRAGEMLAVLCCGVCREGWSCVVECEQQTVGAQRHSGVSEAQCVQ